MSWLRFEQALKLLRWQNLFIVALNQLLVYAFLRRWYADFQLSAQLDAWQFGCLVLSTLCLTATGYLINDLYDLEADRVNRPDRPLVSKQVSVGTVRLLINVLYGLGILLWTYIAWCIQHPFFWIIFPFIAFLLRLYSRQWQHQPLIGNLTVAVLCALVSAVVWLAEYAVFIQLSSLSPESAHLVKWTLITFIALGFIGTLVREIIKDIEDMAGDKRVGAQTLPIYTSVGFAKKVIYASLILLFIVMGGYAWLLLQNEVPPSLTVGWLLPICCTLVLWQKVYLAHTSSDFTRASRWAKLLLMSGLVVLALWLI